LRHRQRAHLHAGRSGAEVACIAYTYTADGLRVGQETNGIVTTYAWDWASPVPELLSQSTNHQSTNSQSTAYLVGHDTLGWWDGAAWAYILADGLGSVRQAADGAGAVVSAREWTPYGEEVGGWQAGLGYTGEWQDAAVGLVYLRARWYAPGVGIFTAPDPFPGVQKEPGSLHPYRYVLGNPVNGIDPSGSFPPGALCNQDECDPNNEAATRWLVEAMSRNAVSPEARTIRLLNQLALSTAIIPVPVLLPPPFPPLVGPCPALGIPPKALAYWVWIEMVKTGAPWDFKEPIFYRWPGFEWGGENIRMCCGWYWYEAVANIHYGYVGRAAGFTDFELKAGAGAAQYLEHRNAEWYRERIAEGEVGWHTYYDEPEDQAGIQIGLDLYNGGIPLTPEKFCEVFNRWAPQLKPARWPFRPWI